MRAATFTWTSPPPTSVDEVLVIEEDGAAHVVIRRPRRVGATVGSYRAIPSTEDLDALLAAGPGPVTFEVHRPDAEQGTDAVRRVAERVVEACLASPRAAVTFGSAVTGVVGGRLAVALLATAEGPDPVAFELRPESCVVHLSGAEGEITWQPMPRPATGFVTASAVGLGGLDVRARLVTGTPAGDDLRDRWRAGGHHHRARGRRNPQ